MKKNPFKKALIKAANKAIELAGGQTALARLLGKEFKQYHMQHWKNHGIPAKHAIRVEKALKRAITRYELRPDIYPKED
jgi:DNA-binding transcriptional regulator YdaS (Cro superfamily)